MRRIVLASGSPRRKELLEQAGFAFEVHVADIDESVQEGEAPRDYVRRLALEKAQAVAALMLQTFAELPFQKRDVAHTERSVTLDEGGIVVLGADTTVVLDGEVLGKPCDRVEAERMLRRLSGKTHQVLTGVAVVSGGREATHVETTEVKFREIGEAELAAYLETGDPLDKAGAYGIQGYAARWIPRIEGDYFNVMGLPISVVVGMVESI